MIATNTQLWSALSLCLSLPLTTGGGGGGGGVVVTVTVTVVVAVAVVAVVSRVGFVVLDPPISACVREGVTLASPSSLYTVLPSVLPAVCLSVVGGVDAHHPSEKNPTA